MKKAIITINLYSLEELSESSKSRARVKSKHVILYTAVYAKLFKLCKSGLRIFGAEKKGIS